MLGRVREGLRHDVIRRGLDRLRQPAPVEAAQIQLYRHRRAAGGRLDPRAQAALGEDRGVDAAGDLPDVLQRIAQAVNHVAQFVLQRRVDVRHRGLGAADRQAERHQALLQPVVQIAFDPAPGVVGGCHRPGAGGGKPRHPGQLHARPDSQLCVDAPDVGADRARRQRQVPRDLAVGEAIGHQPGDDAFGLGEGGPAGSGHLRRARTPRAPGRRPAADQALPDLGCGAVGERKHQRMEVRGGARQVDHPDQLPGGIGDRARRTRHPAQRVGEVLGPPDHGGAPLSDRGADGVRPDALLAVQEARGELDAVEQPEHPRLGCAAVQDVAPHIGQQEPHSGIGQVVCEPVDDGSGGPVQRAILVDVRQVRHLKALGMEAGEERPLP
jgi:hypothetical protein